MVKQYWAVKVHPSLPDDYHCVTMDKTHSIEEFVKMSGKTWDHWLNHGSTCVPVAISEQVVEVERPRSKLYAKLPENS